MFWGKKKQEPIPQAAPPQPQERRPAAPAKRPASAPRPETKRVFTAQDLPEMLLAHANVTREQLQHAFDIQRSSGEFIGEILVNEGVLDESSLVAFLAKYCKIPHLSLLNYLIDESLLALIPPDFCLRYRLVPIDKMGRNLTVAMVNPLDAVAMSSLHERCPDLSIKPILCTTKHFDAVTTRLFERKSVQQMPPAAEALSPAEQELFAAVAAAPTSRQAVGLDLDAADMSIAEAARLPLGKAIAMDEELPLPDEFNDADDVFTPPPVEVDSEEALLDSVFALNSEGLTDESGDGLDPDGGVLLAKMTRKMARVMVNSMRNTYGVLARRVSLFRGLDPESVAKLFSRGKTVEFDAGQTVFSKGELGRCMYVILSGSVEIIDDSRTLARLEPGENFGEMALMSNAARSASVKVVEPASLLMLSFADITQDLDSATSVQLLVNITVTLSSRLRKAQAR